MKKIIFSIALFLVLSQAESFAQDKDEDVIAWSASRKLAWSDYKASPDPDSDAAASTTTFLSIEYKISSTNFSYKIKSRFSRDRSWGRHKSPYILSHEQGHFDIAEVFARKLHKEMSEYKFTFKTYQKDLKKIYDKVTGEKEEMQNEYDRETRHSINREEQAKWLQKIEEMLEEYNAYADY